MELQDERSLVENTARQTFETSRQTAAELAQAALVARPGQTALSPFVEAQEALIRGGTTLVVDTASEIGKYLVALPIRGLSFGAQLAMKGLLPEITPRSGFERER